MNIQNHSTINLVTIEDGDSMLGTINDNRTLSQT